jgi:hypothetical protein
MYMAKIELSMMLLMNRGRVDATERNETWIAISSLA